MTIIIRCTTIMSMTVKQMGKSGRNRCCHPQQKSTRMYFTLRTGWGGALINRGPKPKMIVAISIFIQQLIIIKGILIKFSQTYLKYWGTGWPRDVGSEPSYTRLFSSGFKPQVVERSAVWSTQGFYGSVTTNPQFYWYLVALNHFKQLLIINTFSLNNRPEIHTEQQLRM